MTNKDIRLKYEQETGDGTPFRKKQANKPYVDWLENKLTDLLKEIEKIEENEQQIIDLN